MAFIGAIFGKANFNDVVWHVGDGDVFVGKFITALINFLIIAATLFVIIRAFEELQKRRKGTEEELEDAPEEIVLLSEIRDLLAANNAAGTTPPERPPVS